MSKYAGSEVDRVGVAVTLTRESALALIRMLASYGDEDRTMLIRLVSDGGTGLQFQPVVDITIGGGMGCMLPVSELAVVVRDGEVTG